MRFVLVSADRGLPAGTHYRNRNFDKRPVDEGVCVTVGPYWVCDLDIS